MTGNDMNRRPKINPELPILALVDRKELKGPITKFATSVDELAEIGKKLRG